MTRPHPFDVAFGGVAEQWLPAIQAEARGIDPTDIGQFARLEAVRTALAGMGPPAAEDVTEQTEELLRLLYAAYHFWAGGQWNREVPRTLPAPDAAPVAPALDAAVYCHLPEHLYWAQVDDASPHEPVDGFFVAAGGRDSTEWTIVAILGLREEREGFSQVSVIASKAELLSARSPREEPFAPIMEGGGLAGFRSIASVGELLTLVRLALVSTGG